MSMYWIYDLQNWSLCLLILAVFLAVSQVGLFASRPLVRWILGSTSQHNDIVSYFFAGIGVFYGLALGLIAVATWENYTEIDGVIGTEAAAVALVGPSELVEAASRSVCVNCTTLVRRASEALAGASG